MVGTRSLSSGAHSRDPLALPTLQTVHEQRRISRRRASQLRFEVYAPNGFDDIEGQIVRPNRCANFSAANYATKTARWKQLWPELTVLPADL
jgi:uncharacterized protein